MVVMYPLFKRVTNFPQVILGLIFNWGILIGFLTQNNQLELGVIYLYLSGIFFNRLPMIQSMPFKMSQMINSQELNP